VANIVFLYVLFVQLLSYTVCKFYVYVFQPTEWNVLKVLYDGIRIMVVTEDPLGKGQKNVAVETLRGWTSCSL